MALDRATLGRTDPSPSGPLTKDGQISVSGQGIYEESATQNYRLGQRMALSDGRVFYYAKAGSTAITRGQLLSTPINRSQVCDCVATSAGSDTVQVTAVAAMSQGDYADGFAIVHTAGPMYKIRNNDEIAASGTGNIYLYDPLVSALTTSEDLTIFKNPLNGLIKQPDLIAFTVGVSLINVTASYYFWVQTYGPAMVGYNAALGNATGERMLYPGTSGTSISGTTYQTRRGAQCVAFHMYDSTDGLAGEYELVFLRCMA